MSGAAINNLKNQYNSLLGSLNNQQAILQKRAAYRSQIIDIVALGASLAAPINSAMKFESVMADVNKVVDFSTIDGLQKMGDSLKELSRVIPLSVEGLAQIAAAGGQLGVAEKDLISFTKNVAKMSTAFDMLPDEAGKSMATLSNVFNIPITSLTQLGDAINHISNNSAASARAVIPALARMGGAARQFGLTAEKASALVGTLIAMGKAPEEAGTSAAAILQRLQLADKLGTRAEKAFRRIGLSAKTFSSIIAKDAQGALLKFFDMLSKVEGQNRASVLVDIFVKNYSSTVATLVGSLDKYKQQLQLISDPKNYATSMEKEFLTRSATTENSIQILKNAFSEFSITLGNSLLPTISALAQSIGSVMQGLTGWISKNPELTRTITHLIGGLVGMKLATFTLGYAATFLFGGLNRLVIIFKGLRLGLALAGTAFRSFFKVGPLAFIGIACAVYENWETVKNFLMNKA
ncbi:MAG: phage tail tape measure protein [Holosporaceae bacterium]|nr:phage tail tape measure protein [Holosporaceae bacterium]